MINFHEPKKLPPLQSSHWPQLRQYHVYRTPLRDARQHAEHVQEIMKDDPAFFERADDLPYGAWLMKDASEILFDFEYRPIWKRRGEGYRATRCDPATYFDWFATYWLYDHSLLPKDSPHLREILAIIVEEFCAGRSLWVRRWKPETVQGGKLVQRVRTDRKSGLKVITNYNW